MSQPMQNTRRKRYAYCHSTSKPHLTEYPIHTYTKLFEIMDSARNFIKQIQTLYENATASVQINGHVYGPIPILSSIRRGCPISMQFASILYSTC
jgi:hypothetical protein